MCDGWGEPEPDSVYLLSKFKQYLIKIEFENYMPTSELKRI